jgi:DNA-binding GntR family transcriptional regulator
MQKVKHGMLRVDVYNRIRDNILNHMYREGEALTESRISSSLGVSRTPVREAFAQLNMDGLVDSVPNKGVIVRGLHVQDIKDMYDIRAYVEGIAARRACENITGSALADIREVLGREEQFTEAKDINGVQLSDFEFHDAIIQSSGSRVLENLLISMMQHTRIARVRSLSSGTRTTQALREHYAIYNAINDRDSDRAQRTMEEHVRSAKESFIKTLIEKENQDV